MTKENNEDIRDLVKWGSLLAMAMLLVAILNLPYGYYTLLRLVICGISASFVYFAWYAKRFLSILAGITALLFNPLIPIYLEKETWILIDIIVTVFFLIYWRLFNRSHTCA
jgi:hypothetical protein